MESALSRYVRTRREESGLSLRSLAERAGVSKSALSAWERGVQQPSLPELDAVLEIYRAGPDERVRILQLIDAPRARREVRRAEVGTFGFAPHTSESIFRAMRIRRGLSPTGLGKVLGVNTSTIGRWERGETWPNSMRLADILDLMDAQPAEREALWRSESGERIPPDLDEVGEFLFRYRYWNWGQPTSPFAELKLLGIVDDLWPLVQSSSTAEGFYREAAGFLASWFLLNHGALDEAARFARRAIAGDDGTLSHYLTAWPVHILAKESVSHGGRTGPQRGVEYLRGWLPRAASNPHVSAWYLRDIAEFAAAAGELDSALRLSQQAISATVVAGEDPTEAQFDHARLLIRVGRAEEALPLLPARRTALPFASAILALTWAEALLDINERNEVDSWLEEARALIEENAITALRPQLRGLALRL